MTLTENEAHVMNVLQETFKEKGKTAPPLEPSTILNELGLESLDFAQAVIRLEEITGKDPFANGDEFQIQTVSDFAAAYN